MHEENQLGYVQVGTIGADFSLEDHEGYKRFVNRHTGGYTHNEHNLGYAEYGALGNPDWWSAYWELIPQ